MRLREDIHAAKPAEKQQSRMLTGMREASKTETPHRNPLRLRVRSDGEKYYRLTGPAAGVFFEGLRQKRRGSFLLAEG